MKALRFCLLAIFLNFVGIAQGYSSDLGLIETEENSFVSFEEYISETPIAIEAKHTFYANIPYGPYEKNALDIWVSNVKGDRPLVIYIHGGGFRRGDKKSAWANQSEYGIGPQEIETLLKAGISFASINYRLLEPNEQEGVLKCLNDSKRAIQFLKYHAEELTINADKVALTGNSAGAGTCLWIATQGEMKKPSDPDPILAVSTEVCAIALNECQGTYDIERWFGDVFPMEGSLNSIQGTSLEKKLLPFYGVSSVAQLQTPAMKNYRQRIDMLSMISSDDPPIWLRNGDEFKEKNGRPGNLLHSPFHAMAIKKAVDEVGGIKNYIYIPAAGVQPDSQISLTDFLIEELNK